MDSIAFSKIETLRLVDRVMSVGLNYRAILWLKSSLFIISLLPM